MPPGIGYGINPQIIMRALRQRGLLPSDETSGIGQPPFVPQGGITPPQVSPMAGRRGSPQISEKPGGFAKFLQTPGLSDALIATGSALMSQSDTPGTSFAGALGRSVPVGMQAFEYGQQKDEMRKQEEALDEALKDAPPEMRRLLAALPMAQKAQMAMQMLQPPEEPDPFTLSPGEVRYGPDGQPIASVPDAPDTPPSIIQELGEWREANPDMAPAEQLRSFYAARRAPGTTVNVGQQSPADEALVGIEASDVEQAMGAANTARDQLGALRQVGRLLDEGVETGAMEERLLPVRQLATAFGVGDADQLIAQENFRALTNEIAIGMTQKLSGQISERELDFVRAAVPNLGSTPEANRRMVEIGTMANETAIAVAEAKREHFRENGTLEGFESKRKQIVREMLLDNLPNADTSMVDDPETRLEELIGQGLSLDEIQAIARREGWAR